MFWFDALFHDDRYDNNGGPNRRNWAAKSETAIYRERQAKELFHNTFLPQANASTTFPFTMKGLIEPIIHLVDASWRDFKKEITKYGCTAKRREVTPSERKKIEQSGTKLRKHKVYWIDVSIAHHPDQVLGKIREKKQKAEDAKRKKEARAQKIAEEKRLKLEEEARQEAEMMTLVDREYEEIVKVVHGDAIMMNTTTRSSRSAKNGDSKKRSLEDVVMELTEGTGLGQIKEQEQDVVPSPSPSPSPSKKLKASPTPIMPTSTEQASSSSSSCFKITAPISRLLVKMHTKHSEAVSQIKDQIAQEGKDEEKRLMDELDQRMKVMENKRIKAAEEYRDAIETAIRGFHGSSSPTSTTASMNIVVTPEADDASIAAKLDVDVQAASMPQSA